MGCLCFANAGENRNDRLIQELSETSDFTSYVEIGRSGVTGPSTVHGNAFIFPLVGLLAVLNLQSSCVED